MLIGCGVVVVHLDCLMYVPALRKVVGSIPATVKVFRD